MKIQTNEIILNSELSPINKVYNIARNLHKAHQISDFLWYAVLELKDKNYNEIVTIPDLPLTLSDKEIKALWDELEDIPMNPKTECIEKPFFIFPAGTNRKTIWCWFSKYYSKGVVALIDGESEDKHNDV
jgi:hypothetical protein